MENKTAKIYDNFGRPITYARLSVTDRCNLRCFYCMPGEGIDYVEKIELLTYEEMQRLLSIFAQLGIEKVRITGGEPFVRKNLIQFLDKIAKIPGLEQITITTNGILTAPFLPALKKMGINQINLSLDTLNKEKFLKISRRDEYDKVWNTFRHMIDQGFKVKINAVIMEGINDDDILPLTRLIFDYPVSVRFIEEMPFNGKQGKKRSLKWNHERMLELIRKQYPEIKSGSTSPFATANIYEIPKALGNIGIIAAYSRTFCGTCNRIRVTSTGQMRTCLYGKDVLNLKSLLRDGTTDEMIMKALTHAFRNRAKDGFEAESNRASVWGESMSTIGG